MKAALVREQSTGQRTKHKRNKYTKSKSELAINKKFGNTVVCSVTANKRAA
jgi:hypothetical protein